MCSHALVVPLRSNAVIEICGFYDLLSAAPRQQQCDKVSKSSRRFHARGSQKICGRASPLGRPGLLVRMQLCTGLAFADTYPICTLVILLSCVIFLVLLYSNSFAPLLNKAEIPLLSTAVCSLQPR